MENRMQTITTKEIIARLHELKPQIFQQFQGKEIELFGSRVREEQK